ncbi:MAG: polysaccharide deacetylase family protein [Marinilabiliaceae bacterium]|nr:polysaccharide deacetylase family protein [Marinilabiliaceae bacterium]
MSRFYTITLLFVMLAGALFVSGLSVWYVTLTIFIYSLVMVYASAYIGSGFYAKAICHFQTDAREVAITFDDGPDEKTEQILELLKEAGFKASFFCIGQKMEKHPRLTERIVDDGHLLGNHTWSHDSMFPLFLPARINQELVRTNNIIEQHIGQANVFFRPPYGVTNPFVSRGIRGIFQKVIGWNVRSLDTTNRSKEQVLHRITKNLQPGQIILLHDTSQFVVQILQELIIHLKQEGYTSVALHHMKDLNSDR